MELAAEEAAVTIKVVSVNGKRMSKAIYNQLPRRSPLSNHDSTVQGRLWGLVVDPKCCRTMHGQGWAHWHVLYERDGELAVWTVRQDAEGVPYNLRSGGPYEPSSRVDREFVDACALEAYQGSTDFFQGRVLDLIHDEQVATMIEDIKVYLSCSSAVLQLRDARKEHASAVKVGLPRHWPTGQPTRLDTTEKALTEAESGLRTLYEQRGLNAGKLYADLVADVHRIKQARVNYAAALGTVRQLPQLFLGA